MSTPSGWEGILNDGEEILWQGRPSAGLRLRDFFGRGEFFFGLVFTAFAVFWITMASAMTMGNGFDIFPLFGIPFVLVGLFLVIGQPFWRAHVWRNTWYTLTNEAAYIATQTFGDRKLKRLSFAEMNALELIDGTPGTVWFHKETVSHRSTTRYRAGSLGPSTRVRPGRTRTSVHRTGFERIGEARKVYAMIRRQRPDAAPDAASGPAFPTHDSDPS